MLNDANLNLLKAAIFLLTQARDLASEGKTTKAVQKINQAVNYLDRMKLVKAK